MELEPELVKLYDEMSTRLQKSFALAIIRGSKPKDAYYEAGGIAANDANASASAYHLNQNPAVQQFIRAAQLAAISDAVMTKQEALERLTVIARGSLSSVGRIITRVLIDEKTGEVVDTGGFELKPTDQLRPEDIYLIEEYISTDRGVKFKLKSSIQALKMLAEMQGWNKPKELKIDETITEVKWTVVDP